MEVATGRTWTKRGWGPRTLQLREYVLREFWAIIVDDRPFQQWRILQACKCTFKSSCLLRYDGDGQDLRMDRRREMGGFKNCGLHVDPHQMCADRGTKAHSRNAGVPEAKDVIHHALCEPGLCRSFRRPWVGIRKYSCHARRRRYGQGTVVPSAHAVECTTKKWTRRLRKRSHCPFETHTPRTCMLRSVAAVLHRTPQKNWDVNREMKGWGMKGRLVLLPFVDDMWQWRFWWLMFPGTTGSRGIFSLRYNAACVYFDSSPKREAVSTVKKNSAIRKRAMTDRHAIWSKKEWYSKPTPHWRSPAGEDAGHDSHEAWVAAAYGGAVAFPSSAGPLVLSRWIWGCTTGSSCSGLSDAPTLMTGSSCDRPQQRAFGAELRKREPK